MRYKTGFTLIEVLIAIILVGLSIASLVGANGSYTKVNGAGTDLSTAEFIIEQFKELTAPLAVIDPNTETSIFGPEEPTVAQYDDLDDFDGAGFSPPIGIDRAPLSQLAAFSQQVTVENVSASNFEQVVADHSSFFVRVTVTVSLSSRQINSASWIRARY